MQQVKMNKIYGSILAGVGGLLFLSLVASMVASFFIPVPGGLMQPDWSHYLIALFLLSIVASGVYQIRTSREPLPFPRKVALPVGLILGIILAILLYIPGVGIALAWATFGLPMLIFVLIQSPASISSTSPLFALVSTALYLVFALSYCLCAFRVARHSGSVKQGLWSSVQAFLATALGVVFAFSLLDIVAHFLFHTSSSLIVPGTFPGFSDLMNYLANYKSLVQLLVVWLLAPAMFGLLLAIPTAFFARRRTVSRTRSVALASEER